jgi:predicted XRE-type DNA-binding protein
VRRPPALGSFRHPPDAGGNGATSTSLRRFKDLMRRGPAMKEQRFKSVWDAIESSPAEAANMKARSEVMIAIRDVVDKWKVTQAESAKRLGITQPRLNDLVRGRIDKFSLDALVTPAARAGLSVRVKVVRPAA